VEIGKIGPVKNPLTIIAMFAGIAEVSGTVVLPFINADIQSTYVWFLIAFPFYLVTLFFGILCFKSVVLYAPSDYDDPNAFERMNKDKRLVKDYEESKLLSISESVTNAVKENIQNIDEDHDMLTVITKEDVEKASERLDKLFRIEGIVSDKLEDYTSSDDNEYRRIRYNEDAMVFEDRVARIISYLGINYIIPNAGCVAIIAIKKDTKKIPIEVKYYEAPLTGIKLARKLAWQIKSCISTIGGNEFILIISSSVSQEAAEVITRINSENKINIVTGNTRKELVPQLQAIFDI
jgi:hypothetical protein